MGGSRSGFGNLCASPFAARARSQPGRTPMEPASIQSKAPRTGSLENPEVVENVPGHVIPILEREFDDFDTESTRFLKGELEQDDFIKFRLKQGVYGQRQADVQMVRVKLPMGGVTPDQLDAFADVIEKYVPLRKGHITTRQNIQMHHVPLPDAASAHPRARRRGPVLARGLRQHDAQRHRRPPRRARWRASCSTSRPTPGPTSATSSATPRRRRCRARSRRRSRPPTTTTPSPRSTTWPSPRASATGSAASRCASAAAPRSCPAWRRSSTSSSSSTTATT